MSARNPHYQRGEVGDLVAVVTSHTKYERSTGLRVWLERSGESLTRLD